MLVLTEQVHIYFVSILSPIILKLETQWRSPSLLMHENQCRLEITTPTNRHVAGLSNTRTWPVYTPQHHNIAMPRDERRTPCIHDGNPTRSFLSPSSSPSSRFNHAPRRWALGADLPSNRRKVDARHRRPRHARGRLVNSPWRGGRRTPRTQPYPTRRRDKSTVSRTRVALCAGTLSGIGWVVSPRRQRAAFRAAQSLPNGDRT